MTSLPNDRAGRLAAIEAASTQRILVMDGAMGSVIQTYDLQEADFRNAELESHPHPLQGNNDLLVLTRPDVVSAIHDAYLLAGADIIETNTFSGTTISQGDYHLEHLVDEINLAGARLARAAADKIAAQTGQARLVAGAIGPTNKTLSLSPDVNDPARRDVTFDDVAIAYARQARSLIEGGVDMILIETVFDTLNAKAAIAGVLEVFDELGTQLPIWISGTITDRSGRTLSGQTVEAFWNAIRHANPWAVGLNCALGAAEMRPFLADLARVAQTRVSAYPNAGLPNAFGGYDETPHDMCVQIVPWAKEGLLNIVGGCCGTNPDHIRHIADHVRGLPPRVIPRFEPRLQLSGLEAFSPAG